MPNTQLSQRIYQAAKLNGQFLLRSGTTSTTYFDKYRFEADPMLLYDIVTGLRALVPTSVQALAGLEMGGIPLATLLSQQTNLPCAFIRKEAKTYGTCRYAEGATLTGQRVVLVEDVVSTGGALVSAITKLQQDNVQVIGAVCVIDREAGGQGALAALGVPLVSLFTMAQLEPAPKT